MSEENLNRNPESKAAGSGGRAGALSWGLRAALLLAVAAVFARASGAGFVGYDDDRHVLDNPLIRELSMKNLARILSPGASTSYYPVRTLSLAADHLVWGLDPRGYHLANVALHAANVFWVFAIGRRLARREPARGARGWPALAVFLGAAFFAVHPVIVEPVMWVSGREELLMAFFVLAALWFHMDPGVHEEVRHAGIRRLTSVSCAALACLSNVAAAVVPVLAAAWDMTMPKPAGRSVGKRLALIVGRTWPLWLMAAAAVALKAYAYTLPDPRGEDRVVPLLTIPARSLTVLNTVRLNLTAILWPRALSPIYPFMVPAGPAEPGVLAGLCLLLLAACGLWLVRRNRPLLFGFLWVLIALGPAAQVVPHHIQRADRFLYLPIAGLAVAAGLALARVSRAARAPCAGALAVLLAVLGVAAWRQTAYWHDPVSLFSRVLDLHPRSHVGHYNLAIALARRGDTERALAHYREAIRIEPAFADAHYNLGNLLRDAGRTSDALPHYAEAARLKPDRADVYNELGQILFETGHSADAERYYTRALALDPYFQQARNNLGVAAAARRQFDDAIRHFSEALTLDPGYAVAHKNIGFALLESGRNEDARVHFSRALAIRPDMDAARLGLQRACAEAADK
ncbi:MAG: tetratricopeptide repeat protein [Kiritimatiellae bacterium]|nr:tetratricopeptide repeat protein [Kiritimatiellia bacterium]